MVSIDLWMLGLGLAVVWGGLAAYLLRLGLLADQLSRQVRSLKGAVAMQRQQDLEEEG